MTSTEILLLDNGSFSVMPKFQLLFVFQHISHLMTRVKESINTNNLLKVIIPSELLQNDIDLTILKNRNNVRVYVYYNDDSQLQRDKQLFEATLSNFICCHQRSIITQIQGYEIDESIREQNPVNKDSLLHKLKTMTENVKRKRPAEVEHSDHSKRISAGSNDMNSTTIFSSDFVHLPCGHLIASSCFNGEQRYKDILPNFL